MAGKGKPGPAPGQRFGGRKKGTPNRITGDVRAMILAALDKVGGEDYLVGQARTNPTAFLTLLGKVLPMQVSGEGGGPVFIVTGVPREMSDKNCPGDDLGPPRALRSASSNRWSASHSAKPATSR
jgi:hypothetical protein